ncbi:hypothetical protein D3C76_468860 [compost metagenome]
MVFPGRCNAQAVGLLIDIAAFLGPTRLGVIDIQLHVGTDRAPLVFLAQAEVFTVPDIVKARQIGAGAPSAFGHVVGATVGNEVAGDVPERIGRAQILGARTGPGGCSVEVPGLDRQAVDIMAFQ